MPIQDLVFISLSTSAKNNMIKYKNYTVLAFCVHFDGDEKLNDV